MNENSEQKTTTVLETFKKVDKDIPLLTINAIAVSDKAAIRQLVYKDFYIHNAFIDADLQLSSSRANKVILKYLGIRSTSTLKYALHHAIVNDMYIQHIKRARSTFINVLKKHVQAYNFNIDLEDGLRNYCSKSLFYSHLYHCYNFARKDFNGRNDLFTSKFFVSMYKKMFIGSKVSLTDTNSSTLSLLLVGLYHVFQKLSLQEDQKQVKDQHFSGSNGDRQILKKVEDFSSKKLSPWPKMYSILLNMEQDNAGVLEMLNNNRVIDWAKETSKFIFLLQESSGYKATSAVWDSIRNMARQNLAKRAEFSKLVNQQSSSTNK